MERAPGEAASVLRALAAAKGDEADVAAVSVNYKLGRALGRQGVHLECEETLRRALAAEQLLVGAETPMVAEIVTELSKVKMEAGEAEQAGQLAAHAVSVWERRRRRGTRRQTSRRWWRRSRGWRRCGCWTARSPRRRRTSARSGLEYMLGPTPRWRSTSARWAAYAPHGEWEKAEFCYCRARSPTGSPGPLAAYLALQRAGGLHRVGTPARRGSVPARAAGDRGGAGHEPPGTATYLNNLGETAARGRFEDAEPMYVRALAIDESTQGVSHPSWRSA